MNLEVPDEEAKRIADSDPYRMLTRATTAIKGIEKCNYCGAQGYWSFSNGREYGHRDNCIWKLACEAIEKSKRIRKSKSPLRARKHARRRGKLRRTAGAGTYFRRSDGRRFEIKAVTRSGELTIRDPERRTITLGELKQNFSRLSAVRYSKANT